MNNTVGICACVAGFIWVMFCAGKVIYYWCMMRKYEKLGTLEREKIRRILDNVKG